ncbi:low affinity Fe/Cu permease [Flavobacterium sp. CG_9.10]|uniref:low affinity iron permease family protein n=1 Tax=Flavobacterium sp. CG_9.10 TaxID=2787729 RepID=UPI0018CA9662|nr:low affinity iron permease family protein [Flavobacterium sp. CG_9.10]MBG6111611.1 low affinity Fe/Cu permease [Flavobacterium sp. CG_9.10]
MKKKSEKGPTALEKMSSLVTRASGSSAAFLIALSVIIIWLITGPIFKFSDTWQLIINTGTTIITFLMVFLIQRSQNKDSIALHLKLNELIIAQEFASNRLVSIEEIGEDDLKVLQKFYDHLALLAKKDLSVQESHSINSANEHDERKSKQEKKIKNAVPK